MMNRQVIFVPKPSRTLNTKDIDIIKGLASYRWLTPIQVMRRYWNGKSMSRVSPVLKYLTEQGYARTAVIPRSETRGRAAWAYGLGTNGLKLLRREGYDAPERLYLYRQPSQQLPQTLCCNDVLISAYLLSRYQDAVVLERFLHEQDLHVKPNRLVYPDGKKRDIEFDGVLFFKITDVDGRFDQVVCLETDMGSSQKYYKEKLNAYIDYATHQFALDYDTASFSLIVYTPTGETHRKNLITWTEQVLTERSLHDSEWRSMLFFSCLSAVDTNPVDFFLTPTWHQPFSRNLAAPLEVVNG